MQVQEALQEMDAEVSVIQALQQDPLTQRWESLRSTLCMVVINCAVVAMGLVVLCCSLYCCGLCVQGSALWAIPKKRHSPDLWGGRMWGATSDSFKASENP